MDKKPKNPGELYFNGYYKEFELVAVINKKEHVSIVFDTRFKDSYISYVSTEYLVFKCDEI